MVYHNFKIKNEKGFSLVELILVLGISALLLSVSDSIYKNFKKNNNLNIVVNGTVEALRYASSSALSNKGDSRWGVKINPTEVVIFKGDSYVNRDVSFKESISIQSDIKTSGINEIIFEKSTGVTLTPGIITFTNSNNEVKNLNINAKGTITY